MTVQTVFHIEGMSCAACVARVESVIGEVPGVEDVNVNLATGRASITYTNNVCSDEDFQRAITSAGYGVSSLRNLNEKHSKLVGGLIRDVACAISFTLPLLVIAKLPLIPVVATTMYGFLNKEVWSFLELILVIPVVFIAGWRFIRTGWTEIFHLSPGMNSLVMIGAGSAFFYSVVGMFWPDLFPKGTVQSYFVASAVIITLILIGRYLEELARGRISKSIEGLMALEPQVACVVRNGDQIEISVNSLQVGDELIVRPGERLAADGVVIKGESQVDEAMITGETLPSEKTMGSKVIAGTINLAGSITYRTTSIGNDTVLRRIMDLVEQAQNDKPRVQRVADKVASIFVPIVILVATFTFGFWMFLGDEQALAFGFVAAISVLLIACPCAMGLATPTAIMVGTYRGAETGILIKSGSALESLGKANMILFDKTGTLTTGKVKLLDFLDPKTGEKIKAPDAVLAKIAAIERHSEHPLSQAIVEAAFEKNLDLPLAHDFKALPGKGVSATVEHSTFFVGTKSFLEEEGIKVEDPRDVIKLITDKGKTPVIAACDGEVIAVMGLGDVLKPESKLTVEALKHLGLAVGIITGDNKATATFIASQLGLDRVIAETLPGEKASEIEKLKKEGFNIVFVGDGINDAPALVTADTGIAIGTGTDVAFDAAELVLMSGDVRGVAKAIMLARGTLRTIRYNFFWAYGYNVALIPVAAGLFFPFFGWLLNPILAAAAMSISSVFVITNSLRLRKLALQLSI